MAASQRDGFWVYSDSITEDDRSLHEARRYSRGIQPTVDCDDKANSLQTGTILNQVSQTHDVIKTLEKTVSSLEMQLAATRASIASNDGGPNPLHRRKVFFVMGIITAFSSRKRRDSIRDTWMPRGEGLKKLEREKGIILRFAIGHSATPGGVLDRAIDAENEQHHDFLRLNHVEGYHKLSSKTQIYFSTAVAMWDADFYIKVDDDVHVNLGVIGSVLSRHRSKPRVYIGCMKSGPVLAQKGVKYHEPEFWKFGEEGNKYFRHATGQIYALSKDLATYISVNQHILHRFANEDVSLGSWFIGLDVEHIDDRSLCCGTPPDCDWKAQAGNICAASFDWSCSGICKPTERMKEVHQECGEGNEAIWETSF
uniref:Hexosyltransferase n=1 Tax=Kalanchoe fedtschenkoi TaxID=63787 RepID=A0A7N0TQU1_KALFE